MSGFARWAPDPTDPSRVRYWDGQAWTDHTAPAPAAVPPTATSRGSVGTGCAYVALGGFVLVVIITIIGAVASTGGEVAEGDIRPTSTSLSTSTSTTAESRAATPSSGRFIRLAATNERDAIREGQSHPLYNRDSSTIWRDGSSFWLEPRFGFEDPPAGFRVVDTDQ